MSTLENPTDETFHGIDFIDWAAANAHLALGVPVAEVIATLGIEEPQWEEATAQWMTRFTELMTADMTVATLYGEIFQQPKVGAFAKTSGADDGEPKEEMSLERFAELAAHVAYASEQGIDMQAMMADYGVTVGEFAQLQMKYLQPPLAPAGGRPLQDYLAHFESLKAAKRAELEAAQASSGDANLGDDIEF